MLFIFIFLIINLANNPDNFIELKLFILMIVILILFNLPISLATYFYTYIIKAKNNDYIRTKKGEEINQNLEGLKNYLKDFSSLHEKDEKSLALWEDYLIYSVIFSQNTTKNIIITIKSIINFNIT